MALSKKYYERIAAILHESKNKEEVQAELEKFLSEDNPRFDIVRFRQAVITGHNKRKLKEVV